MKKLITILLLLLCLLAHGQAWQDVEVQTGAYFYQTAPGIISIPASYTDSPTKRYPVLFFFHGSGEASGSRNDALLKSTALPYLVDQGQIPKAINPLDGKLYEFIVIAPQHTYFSWGADNSPQVFYYMLNWAIANYRVDTTRVYMTGLSAGGQSTVETAVWDTAFAKRIAAIYPISLTGMGMNQPRAADSIPMIGKHYGVASWTVVGGADTYINGVNPLQISLDYTNSYNSLSPPVTGLRTVIPGQGHNSGTWNTAYDLAWKSNVNNQVGLNMYEWFLKYKRTFLIGGGVKPAAPTAFVMSDTTNNVTWTNNPLYNNRSMYEYTVDSGRTWINNQFPYPVNVGNVGIKKAWVGVRIKSLSGDPASDILWSPRPFTAQFTSTPSVITVSITLTGTPDWTSKINPAPLKYNKWARFGLTVDDRLNGAKNVAAYITGNGIVAPDNGATYAGKRFTDGANVRAKNIPWTSSSAVNSYWNSDTLVDAGELTPESLRYTDLKLLVDNGWSLLDHGAFHGIGLPGAAALAFNTIQNAAQNRRHIYDSMAAHGTPYVMNYGVVPTDDKDYHSAWELLGYGGGSSESQNDGYPDVVPEWSNYGIVPINDWYKEARYRVHLRMFRDLSNYPGYGGTQDFIAQVTALCSQMTATNRLSAEYGVHGAQLDSSMKAFDALDANDNDHVWVCGMHEFMDYFQTIWFTGVKQTLSGNVLTVTLDQSFLSDGIRWRDMSFLLSSNSAISSVTVTGADDWSYNTSTGLINIYKKKLSGYAVPENAYQNGFVRHGKIPLKPDNLFIDNNYGNKPYPLLDNNKDVLYYARDYGGQFIVSPYELTIDLQDYGAVVDSIVLWRPQFPPVASTQIISVRNDNHAEDYWGTFNSYVADRRQMFMPDTTKRYISERIILRSDQTFGYGTEVEVFGTYLPYADQNFAGFRLPIKYELGTNAHWWDFNNNVSSNDEMNIINAVDSAHLTSIRNYGSSHGYQGDSIGGRWMFNPVRQGWMEDQYTRTLKTVMPNIIYWSVQQGQSLAIQKNWLAPDYGFQLRGKITAIDNHVGRRDRTQDSSWGGGRGRVKDSSALFNAWTTIWATVGSNGAVGAGTGTWTHVYIDPITGSGARSESGDWTSYPSSFPADMVWNIGSNPGFAVGDSILILGKHTSQLNYPLAYNSDAGRQNPVAWDTIARYAYVYNARKGRNPNATKFIPQPKVYEWEKENNDSVGLNTSHWVEQMNEPTAYWGGFDDYMIGRHLGTAWSKVYDNNKVFSTTLGAKNADTSMKVSTSGLAVSDPDVMYGVDAWARKNRGVRPKTEVPTQPMTWKARTWGWTDNPYDILQYHNYSYTGGSNQFAGNVQSGLPFELGHSLVAVDEFTLFRNKYAPWAYTTVGEWGYDVAQRSNMNAPPLPSNGNNPRITVAWWATRALLNFNAHGNDYSQWYRLRQDNPGDDTSDATQFATMSMLRDQNGDGQIIRLRPVGYYFSQVATNVGDYVFDAILREDTLRSIRWRNPSSGLYSYGVWSVEELVNAATVQNEKAVWRERTGTLHLPFSEGTVLTIKTFSDNTVNMATSTVTVGASGYDAPYASKPYFIITDEMIGGGGTITPEPPPSRARMVKANTPREGYRYGIKKP